MLFCFSVFFLSNSTSKGIGLSFEFRWNEPAVMLQCTFDNNSNSHFFLRASLECLSLWKFHFDVEKSHRQTFNSAAAVCSAHFCVAFCHFSSCLTANNLTGLTFSAAVNSGNSEVDGWTAKALKRWILSLSNVNYALQLTSSSLKRDLRIVIVVRVRV